MLKFLNTKEKINFMYLEFLMNLYLSIQKFIKKSRDDDVHDKMKVKCDKCYGKIYLKCNFCKGEGEISKTKRFFRSFIRYPKTILVITIILTMLIIKYH